MNKTCILTDEIAQFLEQSFPGQEMVHLMSVDVPARDAVGGSGGKIKINQLPHSRFSERAHDISLPTEADFGRVFTSLARQYSDMVVLLPASWLTGSVAVARRAAASLHSSLHIEVVDSESLGVGLGYLVTLAAGKAVQGADAVTIKRYLKGMIPKVFSVFCLRNLSYLEPLGLIGKSQGIVADMLGVTQVFYANEGELVPVQKIRNARHFVESIQEFVTEFTAPLQIVFLQGGHGYHQEIRTLRERFLEEYPAVQISEHNLSLPLAALLGPQAFGLFLWETAG